MKIENILVVSPMYKAIKAIIEKEAIHKNFRYIHEGELTQGDLSWADALVAFNLKAEYDYGNVKWVHSLGAGVDRFLYKKEWNEDVLLTRTICSFGQRIAEYCLSYLLRDLQYHDHFEELKSQKRWEQKTPRLLNEQKVMVYGTGEIGQTVAKVLSLFGVEVCGVSLSGAPKEFFKEVLTLDSHYSELGAKNFLINTLPLTEKTARLFDEKIFQHLSDAGFINVGRGASLDEVALLEALKDSHLRFAVLDVFAEEPLSEQNPLWGHPKVFITPHISAVTTSEEGAACFLDTLKNLEESNPIKNKVDVEKGY